MKKLDEFESKIEIIKANLVQARRSAMDNFISVSNAEWYSLFKDEIRNSIAIEGIFTNRTDLIDVLEHNKRTDKQKTAAILGYFEAASAMYEYAANQYKEKEFILRIPDIMQIHTLLMRYEKETGFYIGELGDFRKTRAEVTMSKFTPISEFYVRPAIDLLVKWVNIHLRGKVYDPVMVAAMAHVWFESMHPFRDGNGRVGRILLSYILIGCGYINIAIKGISKEDKEYYYGVLEKADDSFESVHREMEQGVPIHLKDIDSRIRVDDFVDCFSLVIEQLSNSITHLKSIDRTTIKKEALLPLADIARLYDYSQDYLRNLINRGKLKGQKKGKTWYVRVQDIAQYAEGKDSKR